MNLVQAENSPVKLKHEKATALPDWYEVELKKRDSLIVHKKPSTWISYSSEKKKGIIIRKQIDTFQMALIGELRGERKLLSNHNGFSIPSWSADASKVAFHFITDVNEDFLLGDLYVVNLEPVKVNVIKKQIAQTADPAWSPEGSKLIFSDFGDIYIADLINGKVVKVVSRGGYANGAPGFPQRCRDFVWSPDGKTIIYEYLADYFKMTKGPHYIIRIE